MVKHTAGSVKLLLPPRQSRGISPRIRNSKDLLDACGLGGFLVRSNPKKGMIYFSEEDFHRLYLAYAITVHKTQGFQFKRVIVPIAKTRLLDRTLIYTALTRGMEQVVFVSDSSGGRVGLSRSERMLSSKSKMGRNR
jgi:hypothetical protein